MPRRRSRVSCQPSAMQAKPMSVRRTTLAPVNAVLDRPFRVLSEGPVAAPAGAGSAAPGWGPVAAMRPRGTWPEGRTIVPFRTRLPPEADEPMSDEAPQSRLNARVADDVPPLPGPVPLRT